MSGYRIVRWYGPKVTRKVHEASVAAVGETLEEAAQDAGGSHWWRTRRGSSGLEGEIAVEKPRPFGLGGRVSGRFGTTKRRGFYGLFHERKTPFLRPAADRNFPLLARRIVKHLGRRT